MSGLVSRARRVFRPSTPRITRLRSSGSSRGCCWSMAIGRTRETETCKPHKFTHPCLAHFFTLGLSTFSTRTLFVSEFFGGSKSTAVGVHSSASTAPLPFSPALTSVFSVFEYTFILWWNSFWTIAPVIAIGLFDRIVGMCPMPCNNCVETHPSLQTTIF